MSQYAYQRPLFLLSYLLCLFIISCENQVPTIDLIEIEGTVLETGNFEPISGASISFMNDASIDPQLSGDNGVFRFSGLRLDDATYELILSHADYEVKTAVVTIENGSQTGELEIVLTPADALSFDQNILDFGAALDEIPLSIKNVSSTSKTIKINSGDTWITSETEQFDLTSGETRALKITIDRTSLEIGSFNGSITFDVSSGEDIELQVKAQKLDPSSPLLKLDVTSLDFGSTFSTKNASISNSGLNTLNWTASEDVDWLSISSYDGKVESGSSVSISFSVNREGLNMGDYSTIVSFESDGGTGSITVLMNIPSDGPSNSDADADGVIDSEDADDDNDGLIEIWTINDLYAIRDDLTAAGSEKSGAPSGGFTGYELARDLDFNSDSHYSDLSLKSEVTTGSGWTPIGSSNNPFNTIFEGNGYTISDLFINRTTNYNGIFHSTGVLSKVQNTHIIIKYLSSGEYSGGLIGFNAGAVDGCSVSGEMTCEENSGLLVGWHQKGSITNCFSIGSITSTNSYIGGLVGATGYYANDEAIIDHSYSTAQVKGAGYVGGILGARRYGKLSLKFCYATGNVIATSWYIGGLVGSANGTIASCYAQGDVSTTGRYAGGLVGSNGATITSSYATGLITADSYTGGLTAQGSGSITDTNYWDTDTSGQAETSSGGTGLTTAQLQGQTTASGIYITWSSEDWDFGTSSQYPALKNMPNGLTIQSR